MRRVVERLLPLAVTVCSHHRQGARVDAVHIGQPWLRRTELAAIADHLDIAVQGSCAGHPDPDLWHRDVPRHEDFCKVSTGEAQLICAGCPIKAWCLETFLSVPTGIYGGRTSAARQKIRERT